MPRRRIVEDDPDLMRWAVSWADFLTLLFAFFVVMYGISSVNQEKYRQLAESLSEIFSKETLNGGLSEEAAQQRSGSGILEGGRSLTQNPATFIELDDAEPTEALREIQARLSADLDDVFDAGAVEISGGRLWVSIEIRSALLFEAGDVIPAIEADPLIRRIAENIAQLTNPIHVEGYTDNTPVSSALFPSNWELSAARAAAVVRMLEMNGVDASRMAAVGFGEHKPAYSNRTPEGQQLNRRIVIVLSRDEAVRQSLISTGSGGLSELTVKTLLVPEVEPAADALEQVETEAGVIFRQAEMPQSEGNE